MFSSLASSVCLLVSVFVSRCLSIPVTDKTDLVTLSDVCGILVDSAGCSFHEDLAFTVSFLNGRKVKFKLRRNPGINVNSPVYVPRTSNNGIVYITAEDPGLIQDFAVYQDRANGASISARCQISPDGIQEVIFSGTFLSDKKEYQIHPNYEQVSSTSTTKLPSAIRQYKITPDSSTSRVFHDYRIAPSSISQHHAKKSRKVTETVTRSKHSIRRKDTGDPLLSIVDVLVVTDYAVYSEWYDRSEYPQSSRDYNVKNDMRRYFSYVINGVDLRYQSIETDEFNITVRLAGIIIIDLPTTFSVIESSKIASSPRYLLNADIALRSFRDWIKSAEDLPPHDHAMLFTGYDLYTGGQIRYAPTSGLAYIETMCRTNGESVSVVEEHGGFQSVGTAAHELGHGLGAVHDGEENICTSDDHYIMAGYKQGTTPENKRLNPWHFSTCSINYFVRFTTLLRARGTTCLDTTTGSSGVPDLTNIMPGQLYTPDEQCQQIWGSLSYVCRDPAIGNASTLCSSMFCRDPNTPKDCVMQVAASGTSCGNKRWCIDGVCKYSEDAPAVDDDCVLGDQPGIAFNADTCSNLIIFSPSYCYTENVRVRCCTSCKSQFTWKEGCEYGDRVDGCRFFHCSDLDLRDKCCGTCGVGDQISSTKGPSTEFPDDKYTQAPVCEDRGFNSGTSCPLLIVPSTRHNCYSSRVETACCQTCKSHREDDSTGCRYGDRDPSMCSELRNITRDFCDRYSGSCCKSCAAISGAKQLKWSLDGMVLMFGLYYYTAV